MFDVYVCTLYVWRLCSVCVCSKNESVLLKDKLDSTELSPMLNNLNWQTSVLSCLKYILIAIALLNGNCKLDWEGRLVEGVLENEERQPFPGHRYRKKKFIARWKNRPIAIYELNACCFVICSSWKLHFVNCNS